jgi:hypothetical protein
MLKNCLECGKEFQTQISNKIYCSDLCAGIVRRRKIRESCKRYQKRIFKASKDAET